MKEPKNIWKAPFTLDHLNKTLGGNMTQHLDIKYTEVGHNFLKGTMPVDHRTTQPFGILHGGASAVLAETLGSVAGNLCIDMQTEKCVGLEINANHIRPVSKGLVTGKASPINLGRRVQVWQIEIFDEYEKLVCISRLTLAVLPH